MSKLGLSLKISVPKSKPIPKPSIKIEAKDKKGYVILLLAQIMKLIVPL